MDRQASPRIRVVVVEDSLTVRRRLVDALASDPQFEVVGEGETGKDAIELCLRLRPDVMTIDMMMPVMTGLAATEYIMAYCPTPLLIVSASINRGEALRTLDALAAGALDVLDKPRAEEAGDDWERRYRSAVRTASRVKVITHPRAKLGLPRQPVLRARAADPEPPAPLAGTGYDLVAIGASTGGPQALMRLLPALPPDFRLPILLVMHLDARFDASFSEWLGGLSRIPVRLAVDDMPLPLPGRTGILIAPADRHLVVSDGRLRLNRQPERNSCRPSIDVLFESLAQSLAPRVIACLMTGMGRDGASGLLQLRESGAMTLAQDEASSVVFGMPAEAIRLGAASSVLPLERFAPVLTRLAHPASGGQALP